MQSVSLPFRILNHLAEMVCVFTEQHTSGVTIIVMHIVGVNIYNTVYTQVSTI